MNFIAGVLLVVMKDEETVFWALVALINNYLHEYFSRSLIGSLVDNKVPHFALPPFSTNQFHLSLFFLLFLKLGVRSFAL